jgi:dephospho-CoA kinase
MRSLLIGLTGGIGTGKSRAAELLRKLGAVVEDSDLIVRELQAPGGAGLEGIRREFGAQYLTEDGALDRPKLGALVFNDASARARLNAIIHPLVTAELERRVEQHRKAGVRVIVVDIPLLLEGRKAGTGAGAVLPFDEIVLIYATEVQQVERVMARDKLPRDAALARVRSQMPIEEKRAFPGVISVDNSRAWDSAEKQIRELWARWNRS